MNLTREILIVPPYVGEFGWELMNWQGRVRRRVERNACRRVVICAPPDRRALYADLTCATRNATAANVVFCPVTAVALPGHANEDHRIDDEGRRIDPDVLRNALTDLTAAACARHNLNTTGANWLLPDFRGDLWNTATQQSFVRLGTRAAPTIDIVLTPRDRATAGERNLPASWWNDLAERLAAEGLRVEFAGPPLDESIRRFSRARLAVGGSTGGLHLASLCGCPQYVWGSGDEQRWTALAMTNRQRYETFWNPLGTPCVYDECGWRPTVEHVARAALRALERVGRKQHEATVFWSALRPKWRLKRGLARILESRDSFWPWRVKELVRRRLV